MRSLLLVLSCFLATAGCYDPEERAQEHYENAVSLLEDGDTTRAMLELKNVFDNDGQHTEARRLYADQLLEQGDVQGAYSQYLRLIEQEPDNAEVRRLVAEIALDAGDWDAVERQTEALLEDDPDNPQHQALELILDYQEAKARGDTVAGAEHVARAREVHQDAPELDTPLRILIDWTSSGPEPTRALPYIERLLERHPESLSLWMARLRALDTDGREAEVGEVLRTMYDRFPENGEVAELLLTWYLSRDEIEAAKAFLRQRAGADDANPAGHFAVINLIRQTEGVSAALEELDRLASVNSGTDLGRRYAMRAALLRFDSGSDRDPDTLARIVGEVENADLKNDGRYSLYRMYDALDQTDRAQEVIATILESDPSHVGALVARGTTLIREGAHADAVNTLRTALDQSPRNERALLLLANAHQNLGNVALAEKRLVQAVELPDASPEAAKGFARFQMARGDLGAAERVLGQAVSDGITDLSLAELLAQVRLQMGDLAGARALLDQLADSEDPRAEALARDLRAEILFRENRVDDSLQFLRESLEGGTDAAAGLGIELRMLRIQLSSGQIDEARARLEALRERFPDSLALRGIEGNMLALEGRLDEAIVTFEALHAENPDQVFFVHRLHDLLRKAGRQQAASDLLAAALDNQPDAPTLMLLRALDLERRGKIDGAVDLYERLYQKDPNNLAVVNNYASTLAYYKEDEASLEKASTIAAPLKGSKVGAFLDTLGYIKMRQGDIPEAIRTFEAAARALPDNPTVAFNLAEAYEKDGREDAALRELERGFELAGDQTLVPKLREARDRYDRLASQPDRDL